MKDRGKGGEGRPGGWQEGVLDLGWLEGVLKTDPDRIRTRSRLQQVSDMAAPKITAYLAALGSREGSGRGARVA